MMFILFFVFLTACAAAAATGAMFPPDAWYENLDKPVWNPPNWIFPVAWTLLYLMIAYAGARLASMDGTGIALALWALQIALNTLWTPIFFGLRKIKEAMIAIAFLWAAVAAATLVFFSFDTLSGWLFVPYLLWVSFAAALNGAILVKNPETAA